MYCTDIIYIYIYFLLLVYMYVYVYYVYIFQTVPLSLSQGLPKGKIYVNPRSKSESLHCFVIYILFPLVSIYMYTCVCIIYRCIHAPLTNEARRVVKIYIHEKYFVYFIHWKRRKKKILYILRLNEINYIFQREDWGLWNVFNIFDRNMMSEIVIFFILIKLLAEILRGWFSFRFKVLH